MRTIFINSAIFILFILIACNPPIDRVYEKEQILKVCKWNKIEAIQAHLNQMEYHTIEKLGQPIIEISKDLNQATYSVQIYIKGTRNHTPIFLALSLQNMLGKTKGKWKIISSEITEISKNITATMVLNKVRAHLGNTFNINSIYTSADCIGPNGNKFKTIIMSRKDDGKMEQKSGNRHTILKHGSNSWGHNLNSGKLHDSIDMNLQFFVKSHELHWLSVWPEMRYKWPFFEGIVDFKNLKAFKISFKDEKNNPVNFYYDFNSYLPLGYAIQINDEGDLVTTSLEDWETINEMRVFKTAVFEQGNQIFKHYYKKIEFNNLTDLDFESTYSNIN